MLVTCSGRAAPIDLRYAVRATCALCLATASCFTTNTYLIPDTVPPGQVTLTPAVEGWVVHRKYEVSGQPFPERRVGSVGYAFFPHMMVRTGVAPRVDVGLDFGFGSPLRGDLKVQLLEGDIGVAVAGVARYFPTPQPEPPATGNGGAASFEVPVIVAARITRDVRVVASPGFVAIVGRDPILPTSFGRDEALTKANYLQMAFGPVFDFNPRFSLFPEVTYMRSITGPATDWFTLGLGFVISPKRQMNP